MSKATKSKKTIVFYTQEELDTIRKYITNGKKTKVNVEELSKILKRPKTGLYFKYLAVRRNEKLTAIRKKREPKVIELEAKKVKKGIDIPKGMVLEFPASKILVEENKVTLFF